MGVFILVSHQLRLGFVPEGAVARIYMLVSALRSERRAQTECWQIKTRMSCLMS